MPKPIEKILLVQPAAFCDNNRSNIAPMLGLGIAYIGAVLEKAGYEVSVLDAFLEGFQVEQRVTPQMLRVGMPIEEIKAYIAAAKPDVVGITSMFTSQRKNMHEIARVTKEALPNCRVIVGGAHPTAAPESVGADVNIDAVVLAEGDNSVVPVIEAFDRGISLDGLDGVAFRKADGTVQVNQKTQQIADLDELPFPARHLFPMEKYFATKMKHSGTFEGRALSMITSRGCQYYCNFCTAFKVFTRKPRMRSIASIMAEVEQMIATYGIDEVWFEDDQFIARQRHTIDMLDALAKYKLKFDTPNGISSWLLNEQVISKMKEAGCYRVNLALESGNQEVLDKIIHKPVKLKDVPRLVKLIRKEKVDIVTFLVVGNISKDRVETIKEIRDSFRFCRKIKTIPHVSYLQAYPGSETLEVAEEKGYLVPGFDWDQLMSIKQQLTTPEWTHEELARVVEEERVKTHAWIWVTSPRKFLATVWSYLRAEPTKTPLLGVKKLVKLVKDLIVTTIRPNRPTAVARS